MRRWKLGIAALVALSSVSVAGSATAQKQEQTFSVGSTLTRMKVLPHRIHWSASPSIPAAKVAEVDFLIDGTVSWVEHHAPYTYGFNGNYLVTTWLRPGLHHFAVRAVAADGSKAATTSEARVRPPTPPPAALVGTWKRTLTPQQAGKQPSGAWVLSITKVGWRLAVPPGGANLIDVGYLAPGLLELRGGIWTRPAPRDNPQEGNGWCDEPFQPVRYHWRAAGETLTLALAGPRRCDSQSVVVAGSWSR